MCILCKTELSSAEEFTETLVDTANKAALALMISLGHRARLFDSMAEMPPSTSAEIAEAPGLQERSVREWLAAMVAGARVNYHPTDGSYHLPPAQASVLTRKSGEGMGHLFQFIPVLAQVENKILDCFHRGGGVPYQAYDRFHEVMAEESGQTVVAALHQHIVPMVPELHMRLTRGIRVLDVGCGSGRALNELARTYPKSHFVGYDLCAETVERAAAEARACGLRNVDFVCTDVAAMDSRGDFDLITAFDAIHDQADPAKVLANIRRALAEDGLFLMQDIAISSHLENNLDHPLGPLIYTISCMHCMSVSLAQDGAGLGAAWGEEKALEMLAEAGFTDVKVERLPHDMQNNYYLARQL